MAAPTLDAKTILKGIDEMALKTGRLEVAIAVSLTSGIVKVNAAANPFTTDPPNLFDLQFNDDSVRITDEEDMRLFKANLASLLPEISSDIEEIPENSNQRIRKVAEFVRVALLAHIVETLSLNVGGR